MGGSTVKILHFYCLEVHLIRHFYSGIEGFELKNYSQGSVYRLCQIFACTTLIEGIIIINNSIKTKRDRYPVNNFRSFCTPYLSISLYYTNT